MNERIRELAKQAGIHPTNFESDADLKEPLEKFAELIVEECRTVIVELYRKTSLELCGPLLTADEEIVKHFYGVEE